MIKYLIFKALVLLKVGTAKDPQIVATKYHFVYIF